MEDVGFISTIKGNREIRKSKDQIFLEENKHVFETSVKWFLLGNGVLAIFLSGLFK